MHPPLLCAMMLGSSLAFASLNDTAPFPIQSKWIKVRGGQLYCEIAGKGEPVIFLHGYTLDGRLWDPQFFKLAQKYQVIRYDLRGYGKSRHVAINIPYSHPNDLLSLMDTLKISQAHVVGLSLGASEGVDFLAQYPHRLLSLTAACGGVLPMRSAETATVELRTQRNTQHFHASVASAEKWKKQGIVVYRREWLAQLHAICGPNREVIWPKVQRMVEEWPGLQRLTPDYRMRVEPPAFIRLSQAQSTRIPILVIMGEHDKGNKASALELMRLVPGTKLVRIRNAGHLANLECPREFTQALEQFLASQALRTKHFP